MCPSAPTAGVGTLWNCQDIPMVGGIPLWACGRSATGRLRMLSKWLFGSMISRSTPRGKIYLAATTYYIRPPPNFEGYPSWLVCPLLPIEVAEDFELIVIIGTGCRVFIVLRVRYVSVGRQAMMDGCLRVTDEPQ